jgi:hypothetical protein
MYAHYTDAKKVYSYSEFEIYRVEYNDGTYNLYHFVNKLLVDSRKFFTWLNNLSAFLVDGD